MASLAKHCIFKLSGEAPFNLQAHHNRLSVGEGRFWTFQSRKVCFWLKVVSWKRSPTGHIQAIEGLDQIRLWLNIPEGFVVEAEVIGG